MPRSSGNRRIRLASFGAPTAIIDRDGLPPNGVQRRPLQIAIEPTHIVRPQPVPLTVGAT